MALQMYTVKAPVNIAVIKYWGKKDEDLIIPVNDSVSVTLSKSKMCAKTTVACSETFKMDRMWLNGKEQDMNNPRLQKCIQEMKKRTNISNYSDCHLHICSENNFPTAAGLASSAAGYACLVKALAALYDINEELSTVARQGSGSACRSMYGGFVQWQTGIKNDGSDSIAIQLAPKEHWPELRIMILVINATKKEVSSTKGMKLSVLTSSLLQYRVSEVVPSRVKKIKEAILKKDFQSFAEITMKDSNQFHAVCLDTYPPIHYLSYASYKIIEFVHTYNNFYRTNKIAYSFDAGCNACLFALDQDVPEILSLIKTFFPPSKNDKNFIIGSDLTGHDISKDLMCELHFGTNPDLIEYIINTKVGNGPVLTNSDEHLLNQHGLPL